MLIWMPGWLAEYAPGKLTVLALPVLVPLPVIWILCYCQCLGSPSSVASWQDLLRTLHVELREPLLRGAVEGDELDAH